MGWVGSTPNWAVPAGVSNSTSTPPPGRVFRVAVPWPLAWPLALEEALVAVRPVHSEIHEKSHSDASAVATSDKTSISAMDIVFITIPLSDSALTMGGGA